MAAFALQSSRGERPRLILLLRRSSNDGLVWVAWANLFARACPITDTGKLSLVHATHHITCDEALVRTARCEVRARWCWRPA